MRKYYVSYAVKQRVGATHRGEITVTAGDFPDDATHECLIQVLAHYRQAGVKGVRRSDFRVTKINPYITKEAS